LRSPHHPPDRLHLFPDLAFAGSNNQGAFCFPSAFCGMESFHSFFQRESSDLRPPFTSLLFMTPFLGLRPKSCCLYSPPPRPRGYGPSPSPPFFPGIYGFVPFAFGLDWQFSPFSCDRRSAMAFIVVPSFSYSTFVPFWSPPPKGPPLISLASNLGQVFGFLCKHPPVGPPRWD